MSQHYLAITIGPVYDTIKQARKTRELWATSYIFSALMERLLQSLEKHGVFTNSEDPIAGKGFLLAPRVTKTEKNGAGVYPDRCYILLAAPIDGATLKKAIEEAIKELESILKNDSQNLQSSFRVLAAQLEIVAGETNSPLVLLNQMLDALEMRTMSPEQDFSLASHLEAKVNRLHQDGGKNKLFINYEPGKDRLPSLLEIATSELNKGENKTEYDKLLTVPTNEAVRKYNNRKEAEQKDPMLKKEASLNEAKAQEEALISLKNKLGAQVKFRHKYVCFIKADGDSMGATIEALGSHPTAIRDFSRTLGQFAQDAVKIIVEYGAVPVYAGGDDLLFVAPVQKAKDQHVFDLIQTLENKFPGKELFEIGKKHDASLTTIPTLSLGVSVSYYKYPMFESLDHLDVLLFQKAKKVAGKNAVSFRVLKHSGFPFEATLPKGGDAFKTFSNILHQCIQTEDTSFLTSVMHRLQTLKPFLVHALNQHKTVPFFEHHFNESGHKASETYKYLTIVRKFCEEAWAEYQPPPKDKTEQEVKTETVINQIYAALRFVQFLMQEDHD